MATQELSNIQEFYNDDENLDVREKFNLNIDEIDDIISSNDNLVSNIFKDPTKFLDEETIILEENDEEVYNNKTIVMSMKKFGNNSLINAVGSDDADDNSEIKVVDNRKVINPFKNIIKAKSIRNFNQTNQAQYLKLIRLIQNRKKNKTIRNKAIKNESNSYKSNLFFRNKSIKGIFDYKLCSISIFIFL